MTSDDNHDDDAQLQQLRAVWVSMRDEEPSDRGLASLMAAARTKAAELEEAASPSWWQRVAATLRRPPVLALATVTLLLGGALVVTQRSSQMKVDETASTEKLEASDTQTKGYAPPAAGSSAVMAAEPIAPTEAPPPEPAKVPKPVSKSRPKATATAASTPSPARNAPGAKADAGPRAGGAAPPVLSIAQDDAPLEEGAAESSAPKPKSTIEQLVKQCETAAARGDCAAARVIAQKILTSSPAAYKSKVATNAGIQRCMPDPAANTSAE